MHDREDTQFQREQIHVPLALVQRTKPDKRSGKYIQKAVSRLYEPQYEEKQRFEHEAFLRHLELEESETEDMRIAITGEPGAGKTTLLGHIAFWVMGKTEPAREQQTEDVAIWVSLSKLMGRSLEEYLLQTWLKDALRTPRATPEEELALVELFKSGRVWLLLDGVDEMTSAAEPRKALASQLTGWVASARVVLTCRLNLWQANVNFLSDFKTYRLLDFNSQQVHLFIDKWFSKSDSTKGERLKAELAKAERARLQTSIQNPLQLTLLCWTWLSREGELPHTKAGLYQKFVQQFYDWQLHRFPTSLEEREKLNNAFGSLALHNIHAGGFQFWMQESFISEQLGNPDDESSLFHLALKLGWLNDVGIAAESDTQEKVYAFFHFTFAEYFAALAIDDWHFFFNHIADNPNHPDANYRIFEPQWKEVILLWLGREDVPKEQLIGALVDFEDGFEEGFYQFQAYFLAAAGIAEFVDCSRADEIVEQIVEWGFGYFNIKKQKWSNFLGSIADGAAAILPETDRTRAITNLEELIKNCQNDYSCHIAAESLLAIDPSNSIAMRTLEHLIENCQDESICLRAAKSLLESDSSNSIAMRGLFFSTNVQDKETFRLALASLLDLEYHGGLDNSILVEALNETIQSFESDGLLLLQAVLLSKIDPGSSIAIQYLEQSIENCQDESTRLTLAYALSYIAPGNSTVIKALHNLTQSQDESIRCLAAQGLLESDPSNSIANEVLGESSQISQDEEISILVERLIQDRDEETSWEAVLELEEILPEAQMARVVSALKGYLSNETYKNDLWHYKNCYAIIWHCAQTLPYSTFYQAWHYPQLFGKS